jgi:hypothetical protein
MRIFRRTFVATVLGSLVSAVRAAGIRKKHSKFRACANLTSDIPPRDYIHGKAYGPAVALSQTALLVLVPDATPPNTLPSGHRMYYYQLKQAELRVDHCSISRVALAIRDDGYWTLSFRADQNLGLAPDPPLIAVGRPLPSDVAPIARVPGILIGATPPTKFTEHIKRNLFMVRVRGYAAYLAEDDPDGTPGRPVLIDIPAEPFWVQRGVPIFPRFQGTKPEIAEFIRTIDRVEVELSYR